MFSFVNVKLNHICMFICLFSVSTFGDNLHETLIFLSADTCLPRIVAAQQTHVKSMKIHLLLKHKKRVTVCIYIVCLHYCF